MSTQPTTTVSYRGFPEDLHLKIKAKAKAEGVTATDVVVRLVRTGMESAMETPRKKKARK